MSKIYQINRYTYEELEMEARYLTVEDIVDVAMSEDYTTLEAYGTLEEAQKALKKYSGEIFNRAGNPYKLTMAAIYSVDEVELDEDGEEIAYGDSWPGEITDRRPGRGGNGEED